MAKATTQTKMVAIEVLYDGEIASGLEDQAYQFLPEGAVIQASAAAAKSLADGRRAKVCSKKPTIDLSASPEKIIAAIDKIEDANERARAEAEEAEGEE